LSQLKFLSIELRMPVVVLGTNEALCAKCTNGGRRDAEPRRSRGPGSAPDQVENSWDGRERQRAARAGRM